MSFVHECKTVIPRTLEEFLEDGKKWTVVIYKEKNKNGDVEKHQLNSVNWFVVAPSFSSGVCGDVTWTGFGLYYGHWLDKKEIYSEEFKEPFTVNHGDSITVDLSAARLLNTSVTIKKLLSGKTVYRSIFDA